MFLRFLTCALVSTLCARGGERMVISVCNFAHVPDDVLALAEDDASRIFGSVGVEVTWAPCHEDRAPDEQCGVPRFTIRMLAAPPAGVWMGRALVADRNSGVMADLYYSVIRKFAAWNGVVPAPDLLGYVIAHEIGHLLLGPGHASGGIMSECWSLTQMAAMRSRQLIFRRGARTAIQQALRARTAAMEGQCRIRGPSPELDAALPRSTTPIQ